MAYMEERWKEGWIGCLILWECLASWIFSDFSNRQGKIYNLLVIIEFMSYQQIQSTLRSLGLQNKEHTPSLFRNPLSKEKIEKYFEEHRATFEKSRTVEASESRSHTSLSRDVSEASRDSSSMSRYKVNKADAQRTKSKPRNLCSNCSKKGHNENTSDYGNAPFDRIKFLEKRIKTLEKEVQKNRKSQGLQQIPGQYFSHVTHDRQKSQQDQFITMCTDMVSKLANIQDPTLKYCWKFIKTNITNALKANEMITQMPSSSPVKKKVAYLVKQIKQQLGVRKTSSVLPMIRKIREDNEVLNKVYQKILNLFQLKVTHPYMLAYYLQDYTQKINRYEQQTSQTD